MSLYLPQIDLDEGILEGVIDLHCHAGPCIYGKDFDEIETAKMMCAAGYRGVLFKQHLLGANRIEYVRQAVPGLEIFGGVTLNHYVGGLNPFAVASCIIFGGKEVKFPNIHSAHHINVFGAPTYGTIEPTGGASMEERIAKMVEGITIFNAEGKILPDVYIILDLIEEADIGLETGHLSPEEGLALIKAARSAGVNKMWVTHGNWRELFNFTPEDLVERAKAGAYIELTSNFAFSTEGAKYTADIIRKVGAERCTMASDLGTIGRFNPIEGMRVFIRTMLRFGISREEIDQMTKDNPAKLLGL